MRGKADLGASLGQLFLHSAECFPQLLQLTLRHCTVRIRSLRVRSVYCYLFARDKTLGLGLQGVECVPGESSSRLHSGVGL